MENHGTAARFINWQVKKCELRCEKHSNKSVNVRKRNSFFGRLQTRNQKRDRRIAEQDEVNDRNWCGNVFDIKGEEAERRVSRKITN